MANTSKEGQEAEKHSDSYKRLRDEQKNKADAIIGFLINENTKSAENILYALIDEIKYYSKIEF